TTGPNGRLRSSTPLRCTCTITCAAGGESVRTQPSPPASEMRAYPGDAPRQKSRKTRAARRLRRTPHGSAPPSAHVVPRTRDASVNGEPRRPDLRPGARARIRPHRVGGASGYRQPFVIAVAEADVARLTRHERKPRRGTRGSRPRSAAVARHGAREANSPQVATAVGCVEAVPQVAGRLVDVDRREEPVRRPGGTGDGDGPSDRSQLGRQPQYEDVRLSVSPLAEAEVETVGER